MSFSDTFKLIREIVNKYRFPVLSGILIGVIYFFFTSGFYGQILHPGLALLVTNIPSISLIIFSFVSQKTHPNTVEAYKTYTNSLFLFLLGVIVSFTGINIMSGLNPLIFHPFIVFWIFVAALATLIDLSIQPYLFEILFIPIIAAYYSTKNLKEKKVTMGVLLFLLLVYIENIGGVLLRANI